MASGWFITGTDTEVGKTHVSKCIIRALVDRGIDVGVMKPVSAGGREDAIELMKAAGSSDDLDEINPIALAEPLSPNLAAERTGVTIDIDRITEAYTALSGRHDRMIAEGAGGLLVPLTESVSIADLAAAIGLPLIIVARATLGTINHNLLTIEAAKSRGLNITGVVYNHVRPSEGDPSENESPGIVTRISGIPSLGTVQHGPIGPNSLNLNFDELEGDA